METNTKVTENNPRELEITLNGSSPNEISFEFDDEFYSYRLLGRETYLSNFLSKFNCPLESFYSSLNFINYNISFEIENETKKTGNFKLFARYNIIMTAISISFFAVFFLLVALNSYYVDEIMLAYVGFGFFCAGSFIQLSLMFSSEKCLQTMCTGKSKKAFSSKAICNKAKVLVSQANERLEQFSILLKTSEDCKTLILKQS